MFSLGTSAGVKEEQTACGQLESKLWCKLMVWSLCWQKSGQHVLEALHSMYAGRLSAILAGSTWIVNNAMFAIPLRYVRMHAHAVQVGS